MISVIMPTHKRPPMLHNTLLSVFSQWIDDFEFVVVDASEDKYFKTAVEELFDSSKTLQFYAPRLNKLKIVYPEKDKNHPGMMKMLGFSYSKDDDDFVVFLDHDDWLGSNILCHVQRAYKEFPDTEMFSTKYTSVSYSNGRVYTNLLTFFGGEKCEETNSLKVGPLTYTFERSQDVYRSLHPFKAAMHPKIISKKVMRDGRFTFIADTRVSDDTIWPVVSHSFVETYIPAVGYIYVAYLSDDYISNSCDPQRKPSETAKRYAKCCEEYEKMLTEIGYKKHKNIYNIK